MAPQATLPTRFFERRLLKTAWRLRNSRTAQLTIAALPLLLTPLLVFALRGGLPRLRGRREGFTSCLPVPDSNHHVPDQRRGVDYQGLATWALERQKRRGGDFSPGPIRGDCLSRQLVGCIWTVKKAVRRLILLMVLLALCFPVVRRYRGGDPSGGGWSRRTASSPSDIPALRSGVTGWCTGCWRIGNTTGLIDVGVRYRR